MADSYMAMMPQMLPQTTAGGMQQMMPFISPDQIAQNQADMLQWRQKQAMAQALMGTQIAPGSGRNGAIAGILTKVMGALQNNSNNAKLSDILKQQFDIENQASQAKRKQDIEDEQRKLYEEIYKGQMTEKAKRDYAKREVVGGMLVDPTDPNASQAIPGFNEQQGALERQKAQIAAQYREAPGAAGAAGLNQIKQIMAMPDSSLKQALMTKALGEGGMQSLQMSSMFGGGAGGGQGGTVQGGPTGEDFLKSLPPAIAGQVKAISEGRQAPPTSMALRSPMGQQLMAAVTQYDPTFDATNFAARSKTRNAFTAGKEGQNLNALNTAIGHAGTLLDAADALGNSDYPLLNKASNALSTAVGSNKVPNFNLTRDAVAGEMTKAFRGAGGSEKDIEEMRNNINASASPDQLRGAIGQSIMLLGSKAQSLNDQYKQAFSNQSAPNFADPHAKATLQKLQKAGVDLGPLGEAYGIEGGAPAQAAPTATATGPNGQKIGLVNGQWVPL